MKVFRKVSFVVIFAILSIIGGIYIYAFVDRLSLDEQRKNITIYDTNGNVMYESNFKKDMQWTPISKIPQFVQNAFVSVEDKRFEYHAGIDPIRISKALLTNISHGDILQGGSTITQQYAKNLFLTNEQNVQRKVQEMLYSARLEMQYSKKEILEGYLNTVYFGHGVYGVNSAAKYFFDKTLDELSIAETAMLIGIPNGPSIYSPFLHLDNAIKRQQLILGVLENNGVISSEEKAKALSETLHLADSTKNKSIGIDQYYIDSIIQQISKMDLDFNQELHIYTYYDPEVQQTLTDAIKHNVSMDSDIEAAGIITQPFTGNILAISGGKDYTISQYNRALNSSRQVASTIKPLLYYCALQNGFTPASQFTSERTQFHLDGNEEYSPTNYGDVYANGKISMINAIALSDNIYAEKTHMFLGINTLHNALLDFGIKQSTPTPSQALGTVSMSLAQLSRIYNTFASEGLYTEPSMIKQISNKNKVIYKKPEEPKRLLNRDETLVLDQMLTATYDIKNKSYTWPSMYGYQPDVKVAVKSGTSDWDSLVIGFNPEYTVGIWTGFDDNRELGTQYFKLSKSIFKDTFNALYTSRTGVWYQPSDEIIAKTVDPISGEEKNDGSTYWFLK
ncbi:MAG: transglycosylase domain-containing protein [Longicatena sp.]